MPAVPYDDPLQLAARLSCAALYGGVLGLNRVLNQKPAGVRTLALVSLGSALAAWMVISLSGNDPTAVSRIMQGAMTGVGFLGAGVIMQNPEGRVEGLTTAASIWLATMLGLSCGAGRFLDGGIALVIAMLLLMLSSGMQERMASALSVRERYRRRRPASRERRDDDR